MTAFINWLVQIKPQDVWYFTYAAWGLISFILLMKERYIISIIYLVLSVIAYLLATLLRKANSYENYKSRYF